MNRYPLWKNLLVLGVVVFGTILALPNIFGDDPALQVSREDGQAVPEFTLSAIRSVLEEENIGAFWKRRGGEEHGTLQHNCN